MDRLAVNDNLAQADCERIIQLTQHWSSEEIVEAIVRCHQASFAVQIFAQLIFIQQPQRTRATLPEAIQWAHDYLGWDAHCLLLWILRKDAHMQLAEDTPQAVAQFLRTVPDAAPHQLIRHNVWDRL